MNRSTIKLGGAIRAGRGIGGAELGLALLVISAIGVALTVWTPITLMPAHNETSVSPWLRVVGGSYLWWALAVIVVIGAVTPRLARRSDSAAAPADAEIAAAT